MADECQYFLVVLQDRLDERINGRERPGGFLRGKDDEILIVLVIVKFKLVVIFFVVIGAAPMRQALSPRTRPAGSAPAASLLIEFPAQRDRPREQASDRPTMEAWAP